MDVSTARRHTGWLGTGGGTRGMNSVHNLPAKLQVEATSSLPPEKPHILLFWDESSGTSTSLSPKGSSSSENERQDLEMDKGKNVQNDIRKMIDKLESENDKKIDEEKKKENQKKEKKVRKDSKIKKKENKNALEDELGMTNLQGLGPETRQGPSPASSYLDSGNLARGTRSSPVGSN